MNNSTHMSRCGVCTKALLVEICHIIMLTIWFR